MIGRTARRGTVAATLALVGVLLPAGAGLWSPPAVAGRARVASRAVEDTSVGYEIRPILGWESTPRKNPDDPLARAMAGGWYSKDKNDGGAKCDVYAFGRFGASVSRAVATGDDAGKDGAPGKDGDDKGDDGGDDKGDGKDGDGKDGDGKDGDGKDGDGKDGDGKDGDGKDGDGKTEEEARPKGPQSVEEMFGSAPPDFATWYKAFADRLSKRGMRLDLGQPHEMKFGKDRGDLYEGVFSGSNGGRAKIMAAVVRRDGFEVAVLYWAPDDEDYVKNFRGAFRGSLKSLRILKDRDMEKAREDLAEAMEDAGGGEAAYAEKVIAGLPPGWTYHRTDHYVVVYDKSIDAPYPKGRPGLIARIGRQLERLREDIYEELFPSEREITAISIVKVTQDREQYFSYGAPQGSAGYWSWPSRELVFFADPDGAKDVTLRVLNHEAFHQYIYYAVGQVAPHSWFNEGHGDYFAGFDLLRGKFTARKFAWRQQIIERAIKNNTFVPLEKFVKFSQAEYYRRGRNLREGENVSQNYAQGWSLIWFLRTTEDEAYQEILPRYFDTLKEAVAEWVEAERAAAKAENRQPAPIIPEQLNQEAREKALAAAFDGIDMQQLEKDWIESEPY